MPDADLIAAIPATIAQLPFFSTGRFPKPDTLGQCRADGVTLVSGREFLDRIRDASLGLGTLGLERGDRVAILSESRPEWLVCDFAILTAGAVTVPIYPTLAAEQVAFILRDSAASIAIVSSGAQLAKLASIAASVPTLRTIIVMDAAGGASPDSTPPVWTLHDVEARGHQQITGGWGVARVFHDGAKAVSPDDVATIIYTSGTTGTPKGVMLTHGNLVANLTGVLRMLDIGDEDIALSFLPLCHAFERIVAYVYLSTGVSMIFAESIDTIARDLLVVRPTVMSGVPRVFEKLYARVMERGRETPGLRRTLFNWAIRVASRRGRYLAAGKRVPGPLALSSRLADRLVFQKIRDGVGGRLRYAVSGSAPLSVALGEVFFGIGLPILEGYGLSETSPVLTVMPLDAVRFGTVGPPIPNVEIRLADDGEILARGPNVMAGYFKQPEATAAAIVDGWFHTGDVGTVDEAGYLRLTDRKKELIVTSGGKKIAPQPIESRLRAHVLIAEAVVVGDRRNFVAALIVPDFPVLAGRLGTDAAGARAAVSRGDVIALFQEAVDSVNAGLAQYERLKKFRLLETELTLAAGELTPTLKVKRRLVEQRYDAVIESMYLPATGHAG